MQSILYTFGAAGASGEGGGTSQVLAAWAPTGQQDGFDTASKRIDYKGSAAALIAGFPKGGKADGGVSMYYSAVQIEREAFGYVTATIYAQGFWASGTPPELSVVSTSSYDRIWPFSNGGVNYYLPGSAVGKPTKFNAGTPANPISPVQPWRVRQVLKEAVLQRQGAIILTSPAATWPGPAKPTDARPQTLIGTAPTNLLDPLLSTEPSGWVQQNFNPRVSAHLDKVILLSWQDTWKWIDRESE